VDPDWFIPDPDLTFKFPPDPSQKRGQKLGCSKAILMIRSASKLTVFSVKKVGPRLKSKYEMNFRIRIQPVQKIKNPSRSVNPHQWILAR